MKTQKEREELKELNPVELKARLELFRKELFSLHLNASTTHIKDYSHFKKLRRSIARVSTYLKEKECNAKESD